MNGLKAQLSPHIKSVYRYLHKLYAKWKRPEQALEYKIQYLLRNFIKIIIQLLELPEIEVFS